MIKTDIIDKVAEETGLNRTLASVAVDACVDALRNAILKGDRIELRGFAVFEVRPRKHGVGRNPRTGEEVNIPPGRTIRFKPGKELRNIKKK